MDKTLTKNKDAVLVACAVMFVINLIVLLAPPDYPLVVPSTVVLNALMILAIILSFVGVRFTRRDEANERQL